MLFEVNQHVGDYEILGLLGAGGMGHVYRARNIISNRIEAMKVLLPDLSADRDLAVRFISEIRTLAGFDHPNIALLHTAFQLNNQLIMVMEYVEGYTLEQRAKQAAIPVADVVEYISQALSALSYAHTRHVIHRDIKPANLMITSHGVVKLMDFGIAKSAVENNLTRPGTTVGSLYYMSPEQVRGSVIDARSDLYSTGIVLYELLAGRRPFESESTFGVLNQQLNTAPQPPIEINPALPPELNAIILKALAKAPEGRYQTAEEFRNELKRFAAKPEAAAIAAAVPPLASQRPTAHLPEQAPPTQPTTAFLASTPPPAPQAGAWEQVPGQSPVYSQGHASGQPHSQPSGPQSAPPPYAGKPAAPSNVHTQTGRGNRSVWIASGALAAVLALIAVAFALPHLLKTQAASSAPAASTTQPVPAPSPAPAPAADPVPATVPTVQQASPQNSSQPSTSGAVGTPSGAAALVHPGKPANSLSASARPGPMSQTDFAGSRPGSSPPSIAPSASASPATASAAETEQLEERYIQLDGRAQAALRGVSQIRKQQEVDGLGMRGDVEAADSKLRSYMQSANQDVHGSRAAQAARDMDKAETELTILEKFLGR